MISLIFTVLNEGDNLHRLLDSIAAQTLPPDEIVVVDGGSTDDTLAVLERYVDRLPLRIVVQPGANISEGRNRAIREAVGDIVAATDAGVVLDGAWLANITRPLRDNPEVEVVAGFFHADPHTPFELAMSAATLPLAAEVDPATFLPSSRSVAFRKTVWARVGGYPEWLDYCEDLVFDLRLKQVRPFAYAPDAIAYFRPRGSLRSFYRQYYHYARGDGKADLWRKRHAVRYATYLVAIPGIFALGLWRRPLWLLYLLGGLVYLGQAYRRLPALLQRHPQFAASLPQIVLLIPVIRVVGDLAKMHGYPAGLRWRAEHHPPDWRRLE